MNHGNTSLACYIFGIFLGLSGTYHLALEFETYAWVQIKAVILSSELKDTRLPSQPGKTQKAIVKYQYIVNDVPYVSEQVNFGFKTLGVEFFEQRFTKKYPQGNKVIAYYNSKHPQKSVLEHGVSFGSLFEFFAGLLLIYAGLLLSKRHNPSIKRDA